MEKSRSLERTGCPYIPTFFEDDRRRFTDGCLRRITNLDDKLLSFVIHYLVSLSFEEK